jgi:hypothetical protein
MSRSSVEPEREEHSTNTGESSFSKPELRVTFKEVLARLFSFADNIGD